MATKKQTGATKLRVLVEGAFGKPDDVIELEGEALAQALASGQVDANPEAVAYAESLNA
jgi:ABC-type nitrate/sulfonate/bicarbonate transport system substrate-binding protein